MLNLSIELNNIKREEMFLSKIITKPDNPYFKTEDLAVVKRAKDWSNIKDGDFILVRNENGVMEGFDDSIFKVSFNKNDVTLAPLSSFVPFETKDIKFDDLSKVKLTGKIIGIIRSLSNEFPTDKFSIF